MTGQVVKETGKTQVQKNITQVSGVKYMAVTGLFAAMITIMTAYIAHIPVGVNGGYIHFGDSLIYLAAVLLPTPYALAAAAIGGGLADLLTAPMWAPATILIKMIIALPFSNKTKKIINVRNVVAAIVAYLISGMLYFIAEYILFGNVSSAFLVSMVGSLMQSGGSAVFFVLFGLALDKLNGKNRLQNLLI